MSQDNNSMHIPTLSQQASVAEKENSAKSIMEEVRRVTKFVGTLQEHIHKKILIPSVIHAWKHKDANIIKNVLNGLTESSFKSLRVESIQFWYSEYAGFRIEFDRAKNQYHARLNYQGKSAASTGHTFTYDSAHLNDILKNPLYRYWKVAPVEIKIIKVSNDVDKVFDATEKRLAVAILAGELDIEAIEARAAKIIENIKKDMLDSKVRDKADDYKMQQAELNHKG